MSTPTPAKTAPVATADTKRTYWTSQNGSLGEFDDVDAFPVLEPEAHKKQESEMGLQFEDMHVLGKDEPDHFDGDVPGCRYFCFKPHKAEVNKPLMERKLPGMNKIVLDSGICPPVVCWVVGVTLVASALPIPLTNSYVYHTDENREKGVVPPVHLRPIIMLPMIDEVHLCGVQRIFFHTFRFGNPDVKQTNRLGVLRVQGAELLTTHTAMYNASCQGARMGLVAWSGLSSSKMRTVQTGAPPCATTSSAARCSAGGRMLKRSSS